MTRIRAGALLAAVMLLSACSGLHGPRYDATAPAQVMSLVDAPVTRDGRARFREIFCGVAATLPDRLLPECAYLLHRLDDEPLEAAHGAPSRHLAGFSVLLVPGTFGSSGDCRPFPFATAVPRLEGLAHRVRLLQHPEGTGPEAHVEALAAAIAEEVPEIKPWIVVGHSAGVVDVLHFLHEYPGLAPRVAAVVSVAGAVNGSPLVDAAAAPPTTSAGILPLSSCLLERAPGAESLHTSARLDWLRTHRLPSTIPLFSLVAFTDAQSMSGPLRKSAAALAQIDPRNDGQLLHYDQVLPGSTLLGYANADHWGVAIPIEELRPAVAALVTGHNRFPRAALLEAILLYVAEAIAPGERLH